MNNLYQRFAQWLQERWYGGKPPFFLLPFSALFGTVTALRRRLIRPVRLPVRVVVVGNLAVGGSGKTPLIAWLARELHQRDVKVGIVTRGYGRRERGIRRASTETLATAVGDEPRWLAAVTGVPVMVGADRVAAVRALLADTPVDIVLSDDGLQHYRLARDVEIVAIDARRGLGNGALLPAGPLREPRTRLTRADVVVLKGSDEVALPDLPTVIRMNYRLGSAERLRDRAIRPLVEFRGQPVRALAAIGDPESFFRALEAEGLNMERIPLADHSPIADTVARLPADRPLLMTAKDAARLPKPPEHAWQVPLGVAFSKDDATILLKLVLDNI